MNDQILRRVCEELSAVLTGRRLGAIFPLSRFETVFDFRVETGLFLFISIEPADPRVYFVRRKMKDLARTAARLSPFLSAVRKHLSGAEVASVSRVPDERALEIRFAARSEAGDEADYDLVIQITGRSANLFLLGNSRKIIDAARPSDVEGQRAGDIYSLPPRAVRLERLGKNESIADTDSVSEFLDAHYQKKQNDRAFDDRAAAEKQKLNREISKRKKLLGQLQSDLKNHGDAEVWKRYGDLLLANTSTAEIAGSKASVKDFFSEGSPEIEIEIGENESITEAAERYYKRYTKARNASVEIARRLKKIREELADLDQKMGVLESAIERRDESYFQNKTSVPPPRSKKKESGFTGARRFISSDGIEILVGKKAIDNDRLTFRIAKSLDFWFHAADYPGSHVVVRNPNRQPDIPQKTLLESAQLAAFYSNAKTQPKAAVNYTQKKFVSKPKAGAPGLARLAKFKTILVEPQVPPGVTKED